MQPFDTALPIDHGALVPWIAIGPPCVQPVRTFENAEMPTAPGPKGPFFLSVGMSRSFERRSKVGVGVAGDPMAAFAFNTSLPCL